jgi:hypothetical protein
MNKLFPNLHAWFKVMLKRKNVRKEQKLINGKNVKKIKCID